MAASVAHDHANDRIISTLEGGYHLNALAQSVAAHLQVLTSV
jgi:acetoin utilization deacetylase AcuC-like enzyme